jgi:hypothetical protein
VAALLAVQAGPLDAAEELRGEIRFQAEHGKAVWLGQQIELQLELWSDGFSFSDQSFVLPEVKGGYLLQPDSSTVKLSENRGGDAWQGLRYSLLFYPQRAGRLEVPPFGVRFGARAGFGTEAAAFEFRTPRLFVEARLPPGAAAGGLLVTSTGFTMESSWVPEMPVDGPGALKVGDALTLEVRRSARDVPGMVFAPLPEFSLDGLRSYPDAARVNDRVNRGSLTGVRTDSVTFICEREGHFEIPEMRFSWWDPDREVLAEKIIPALKLDVAANPAYASAAAASRADSGGLFNWRVMAVVAVLAVALVVAGPRLKRRLISALRKRKAEREAGEPWAFRQVNSACASGSATDAYNAITVWLDRSEEVPAGATLMELAGRSGVAELRVEALALQEQVVSGSAAEWSGGRLARLLAEFRKQAGQAAKRTDDLNPLNPGAVRSR